ncbi:MAG: sugar ABC transporter permease, partial [Clostridia bacterium]
IGGILSAGFDQVFNLCNSLVYSVGDIIDTYAYRVGLSGKMEYSLSTAIGLFKNVVGFVLVILTNMAAKRIGEGEYRIW